MPRSPRYRRGAPVASGAAELAVRGERGLVTCQCAQPLASNSEPRRYLFRHVELHGDLCAMRGVVDVNVVDKSFDDEESDPRTNAGWMGLNRLPCSIAFVTPSPTANKGSRTRDDAIAMSLSQCPNWCRELATYSGAALSRTANELLSVLAVATNALISGRVITLTWCARLFRGADKPGAIIALIYFGSKRVRFRDLRNPI
jgi:hypothetical protein